MLGRARSWLNDIPLADSLRREQAGLLQAFLLVLLVFSALGVPLSLTASSAIDRVIGLGSSLVLALLFVGSIVVLRRGRFGLAVMLAIVGLITSSTVNMAPTGLEGSRAIFTLLALPIVLAGLLGDRRTLLLALSLSILAVVGIAVLEIVAPTLVGYSDLTYDPVLTCLTFVVAAGVLAVLVGRFGQALQTALRGSRSREQELDKLRISLEQQVAERTAALAQALTDVEARATEQAHLLAEVEQQRTTIRELSVPILPVNTTTLVMPLVGALDGARLEEAQEQALVTLERTGARTLLLDVTGVPVVDTQVAQGLIAVVQAAKLLGAEAVLIGIRPEVAQALVGLGVDLRMVRTARDLQSVLGSASEAATVGD
jgi:rsbT co-antagonist protein RsbR